MRALATALVPPRRALHITGLLFLLVAAHRLLPWLFLALAAGVLALTPLQRRLWERQSGLSAEVWVGMGGAPSPEDG